ncbi:MAG: hypothetical protein L0Y72_30040 [Gemmataceae bacterium]|nr:hypothetical protein [Gemmataceae bacterium]MCI0743289.1 hypothetical protein [Gemmataceae bacterium]
MISWRASSIGGVIAFAAFAFPAPEASAQGRLFSRPCPPCIEDYDKPPTPGVTPKMDSVPEPQLQPVTTAALGDSFTSVPYMMGDYFGYSARRVVVTPVTTTTTTTLLLSDVSPGTPSIVVQSNTTTQTVLQSVLVQDPIVSRAGAGFKVADNESPRPLDRFFFTYNYFNNLRGQSGFTPGSTTAVFIPGTAATQFLDTSIFTNLPDAFVAGRSVNVHRELIGFEKTFLGGDASIEMRFPFFQSEGGDGSFGAQDFGD